MKRATAVGVLVSVVWVAAACILLYLKRDALSGLKPNEWGDFFAGVVAPLAFLWLVMGYFQQGEELRLNTDALKAQQEELRRQVQETAELVAHTERQAAASEQLAIATANEARRAELREIAQAQPIFKPTGGSGSAGSRTVINIVNHGATVTHLSLQCRVAPQAKLHPALQFESGQTGSIVFEAFPPCPFDFTITYVDWQDVERTQQFEMVEMFQFIQSRGGA